MKKLFYYYLSLIVFICVLCDCGIKGPLIAPVIKTPQKVTELQIIQRGEYIFLMWKNPDAYTDGTPLTEIGSVEIWMLEEKIEDEEEDEKISKERFLEESSLLAAMTPEELIKAAKEQDKDEEKAGEEIEADEKKREAELEEEEIKTAEAEEQSNPEKFVYHYKLGPDGIKKKKYTFAFKVNDEKDKSSEFTAPVSILTKIVPQPPSEIKARLYDDRITLTWIPPEKNIDGSTPVIIVGYNVYQLKEEEEPIRINSYLLTPRSTYSISQFDFGETYRYFIRASATGTPFYESDNSEIVEIEAKDIFPPKPPEGLVSISGDDFVSLSWEANQEKDLAGYKVWRKQGNNDYDLLTADPILETAFNDYGVKKNVEYFYAVSALDQSHNESRKSKDLRVILRNLNHHHEDLPF